GGACVRAAPWGVPPVNETSGAAVSTVNSLDAVVVLPAASAAVTCSVCGPSGGSGIAPHAPRPPSPGRRVGVAPGALRRGVKPLLRHEPFAGVVIDTAGGVR